MVNEICSEKSLSRMVVRVELFYLYLFGMQSISITTTHPPLSSDDHFQNLRAGNSVHSICLYILFRVSHSVLLHRASPNLRCHVVQTLKN